MGRPRRKKLHKPERPRREKTRKLSEMFVCLAWRFTAHVFQKPPCTTDGQTSRSHVENMVPAASSMPQFVQVLETSMGAAGRHNRLVFLLSHIFQDRSSLAAASVEFSLQ